MLYYSRFKSKQIKEQYSMKETKFTSILDEITEAIPEYCREQFKRPIF